MKPLPGGGSVELTLVVPSSLTVVWVPFVVDVTVPSGPTVELGCGGVVLANGLAALGVAGVLGVLLLAGVPSGGPPDEVSGVSGLASGVAAVDGGSDGAVVSPIGVAEPGGGVVDSMGVGPLGSVV